MKRTKYFLLAMAAMLAMNACTDEEFFAQNNPAKDDSEQTFMFAADIIDEPETRAPSDAIIRRDSIMPDGFKPGDVLRLIDKDGYVYNSEEKPVEFVMKTYKKDSIGNYTVEKGENETNLTDSLNLFYYKGSIPTTVDNASLKLVRYHKEIVQTIDSTYSHLKHMVPVEMKVTREGLYAKSGEIAQYDFSIQKFCIFHFVLDGFIYPVWGPAQFSVKGLEYEDGTKVPEDITTINLGKKEWDRYKFTDNGLKVEHTEYVNGIIAGKIYNNGTKGKPFFEVPTPADPKWIKGTDYDSISYYNLSQLDKKMNIFMVVPATVKMRAGATMKIKILTGACEDDYMWNPEYTNEKEFKPGKLYNFDFTKDGNKIGPEIALSFSNTSKIKWALEPLKDEQGNVQIFKVGNPTPITKDNMTEEKSIFDGFEEEKLSPWQETINGKVHDKMDVVRKFCKGIGKFFSDEKYNYDYVLNDKYDVVYNTDFKIRGISYKDKDWRLPTLGDIYELYIERYEIVPYNDNNLCFRFRYDGHSIIIPKITMKYGDYLDYNGHYTMILRGIQSSINDINVFMKEPNNKYLLFDIKQTENGYSHTKIGSDTNYTYTGMAWATYVGDRGESNTITLW